MQFFIGVIPPIEYQTKILKFQKQWGEDLTEPHITVKAQGALTADLKWLPQISELCASIKPFDVILAEPRFFEKAVLYLSVDSPDIINLHNAIVNAISPPLELQKQYFELADYIPHLTLGLASDAPTFDRLTEMKAAAEHTLSPYLSFVVNSVRVYKQEIAGEPYVKYKDISLGGTRVLE